MPEVLKAALPQLAPLMRQLIDKTELSIEINDLSTFASFLRAVAKARGLTEPILKKLAIRAKVDRIFLGCLLQDEGPACQRSGQVSRSEDPRYPRLARALELDPDLFVQLVCTVFPPTEVARSRSVLEVLVDETAEQISAIYDGEGQSPDVIAAKKTEVKAALVRLLSDVLGTKQAANAVLGKLECDEIPGMKGRAQWIRGRGLLIS